MKKLNKFVILIFAGLLTTTSCQTDFLDINTDPLASTSAAPGALMTTVMLGFSQNKLTGVGMEASLFAQHLKGAAIGNFTAPDRYIISINSTANLWFSLYGSGLKNLKLGIKDSEAKGNLNAAAQLKIMSAYIYQFTADTYGEVPFTEANRIDITNPKFDDGSKIYNGIYDLLEEATKQLDVTKSSAPYSIVTDDPLYYGDLDKWLRFANSLKLRVLLRISDVEDVSVKIKSLISSGGPFIQVNNQNAEFAYFPKRTNQNFHYATFDNFASFGAFNLDASGNRVQQNWFIAAKPLVDQMNLINDPRRAAYFDLHRDNAASTSPGVYVGAANGNAPNPSPSNRRCFQSLFFIRQDKSDDWLTAAESNLYLAEAYLRFGGGDAQAAFRAGVSESMDRFDGFPRYQISSANKTAFLNSLPVLSGLGQSAAIDAIKLHQYLALYGNGAEVWANWRRTKIPALTAPLGASITKVISRYPLPSQEIQNNPNAPKIAPLLDARVYFEKP